MYLAVLENFEVDSDGGYRRINGFEPFGGTDATRPNSTNAILGLFVYADGLIACSGTNIYFTLDGETWLQINRDSVAGGGDNYSTFTGRSTLARTNQNQCNFAFYECDTQYGELLITDEASATKPLDIVFFLVNCLLILTLYVENKGTGIKFFYLINY